MHGIITLRVSDGDLPEFRETFGVEVSRGPVRSWHAQMFDIRRVEETEFGSVAVETKTIAMVSIGRGFKMFEMFVDNLQKFCYSPPNAKMQLWHPVRRIENLKGVYMCRQFLISALILLGAVAVQANQSQVISCGVCKKNDGNISGWSQHCRIIYQGQVTSQFSQDCEPEETVWACSDCGNAAGPGPEPTAYSRWKNGEFFDSVFFRTKQDCAAARPEDLKCQ